MYARQGEGARILYVGLRENNEAEVLRVVYGDNKEVRYATHLKPRLDLANHSPTGLEWGYGGSGPAQLALALLADATGDDELALKYYQRFKDEYVHRANRGGFAITDKEVRDWVDAYRSVQQRA